MSTLRRASESKRFSTSGDATGESTGDSGFADAKTHLKVPIGSGKARPTDDKPSYYKSLGNIQPGL